MTCDNLKLLYDELFGVDDDEDGTSACHELSSDHAPSRVCMPVGTPSSTPVVEQTLAQTPQLVGPPGLALYRQWMTKLQQTKLLDAIDTEGWLRGAANQAMCFGKLPEWTTDLIYAIPLKGWPHQIETRHPLFDQMIVNSYKPGEGIISHVDLLKFDDGIAIISLGAPATMTFTEMEEGCHAEHAERPACKQPSQCHQAGMGDLDQMTASDRSAASHGQCFDMYLEPGDLLLLHGEARYTWKHGIADDQTNVAEDTPNRVSITLRKLL